MSDLEITAHDIAQQVMVIQAKRECELQERRGRDGKKNALKWFNFYDPAAATCLGNLIFKRMVP